MPDVHVDSVIFQYPFFLFVFIIYFLLFFSLHFCNHFAFANLFKVNCILGSLICLYVFPPSASVGFKTFPTTQSVKKKKTPISLVFSGDEFALFWLWKCWCCLDCFGLFQQILFSGVKLLISRCVGFISTGFRFSCLVAINLELGLPLGSNFKFVTVNVC